MDWSHIFERVASVYGHCIGLVVLYAICKLVVMTTRKTTTTPASREEKFRLYAWVVSIVLLLSGYIGFEIGNAPSEDSDDDAFVERTQPEKWEAFSKSILFLLPACLFGLSAGFALDAKLTPGQRLTNSMDEDDLRRRPDLVPVSDSNVLVYTLCCLFSEGFADGSRQDYIDLVIQRAGRPKPGDDGDWLRRVTSDEELRRALEMMVAENASYMTADAKFAFWWGLTGVIEDQVFAREIKRSARQSRSD